MTKNLSGQRVHETKDEMFDSWVQNLAGNKIGLEKHLPGKVNLTVLPPLGNIARLPFELCNKSNSTVIAQAWQKYEQFHENLWLFHYCSENSSYRNILVCNYMLA